MSLVARAFAGESDIPRILALRQAIADHYPHTPRPTEATTRFDFLEPVPGYRVAQRLWEEDGVLAGLGYALTPTTGESAPIVYIQPRVHPAAATAVIGGHIVDWVEELARAWLDKGGQIEVTARGDDPALIALLRERGYRQDRVFLHLQRQLEVSVPDFPLADGYTIRPIAGEAELDDWIIFFNAAFQDHYDFRPWSREGKAQEMAAPWYRPEFDLVAVAPDGALASLCWTTRREDDGGAPSWSLELVATGREHRRKGLAAALIATSIARMNALGGGTLDLAVDATSDTGANRLYERLGFREVAAYLDFRREIGGAAAD